MAQSEFVRQKTIEYPRSAGLIILALGGFLFYTGFLQGYLQVNAHVQEVEFSLGAETAGITSIIFGLILVIFGSRYVHVLLTPKAQRSKTATYILYGAVLVLVIANIICVNSWLSAHGYSTI